MDPDNLETSFRGKIYGTAIYGFSCGPYLRKPFWKSYTDFCNLKIKLEGKYGSGIYIFPLNKPWINKFRWSRNSTERRRKGLVAFLKYCISVPGIWSNIDWLEFVNPLGLDTRLYKELDYQIVSLIEHSNNTKVHRVRVGDTQYAIKSIDLKECKLEQLRNEVRIHERIDHCNCLKFHGYLIRNDRCELILDVATKSVLEILEKKYPKGVPGHIAKKWFYQLLLGIKYLHHHGIVHRDLKPQNMLIMRDGTLKICDFGFSNYQREDGHLRAPCGTEFFAAPEITSGKPYNGFLADIYSAGVVLFAMLVGEREAGRKTISSIPEQVRSLLFRLMDHQPNKRITLDDALHDPWLQDHFKESDLESIRCQPIAIHFSKEYEDTIFRIYQQDIDKIVEREIKISNPELD